MSEWHYYTLPLPVVANSGGSVSLQQMITNAFGYTPANWLDFWVTYENAAQFQAWNLDYWNPSAPVHGAWLVNGGDIGGGLGNQTYVPRSNISNAVLTTGNIIGPYAYIATGISGSPYDVYMQYSLIAVDPDMMRSDATTRAPVAQDIVDAANRLFSEYGYSFNDNDCHYIAAHVGAAAGAVFTDRTQSISPSENEEYGFWRIAYRGSDPGAIAQWQTLLQAGDIVRMGWNGGGFHTFTVLAVNPNGTVQVYDNTFAGPNGGGIGIHTVNYDDITITNTITVYRLTGDGTFLINGMNGYGERLYGSNHFNDRINGLSGNDYLFGANGNDILDGGVGNDAMDGGAGDDTFYVDNALDSVVEGSGAGTDHVFSSISLTLATNVENLTLTGSAVNGNGNSLNNVITGNNLANVILGVGGADTLDGAGGDDNLQAHDGVDVLYGRAGNDTLDGGTGADTMYGGDNNDTYIVDNVGDLLFENGPTGGTDIVQSSVTWSLGAGFENLTLTGSAAINGNGNELANAILGNTGINVLNGRAGADTIGADLGNDTVYGGDGDDVLTGAAGDDLLDGGNNNDQLAGGADVDTLYGRAGADSLDGGAGADVMYGGAGDDSYSIDNASDVAGESAGAGTDTLYITVNYAMGAYLENLVVVGDGAVNGTGNVLNNVMSGAGGANVLSGGTGADTLNGLGGDDTLNGGNGNDTANGGDGADILDGGNDLDTLNGGNDADTLYGRSGNDTLNGDAGVDTIYGGDGDDIANGGTENDLLDGGNNNDTLSGGDGDDDLYGRQHNDTLNGDGGADDLYGGDGDDTLNGGDGADMLDGGNGVDRLDGGLGNDVLIGGTGADTFVLSTAIGGGNVDTITSFNVADDTIELDTSVFTGIGLGALAAGAFVTGTAAGDGDDRIIYNPATGALFYDADGNGAGAAVQIATLGAGLALTAADFIGGP